MVSSGVVVIIVSPWSSSLLRAMRRRGASGGVECGLQGRADKLPQHAHGALHRRLTAKSLSAAAGDVPQ